MSIKPYREKDIRNKILSKIKPTIMKPKRGKHDKGQIFIDGKLTAKVKVPNNHNRIMKKTKSQYIAIDLQLKDHEFNALIDCSLTGPQYYALLRKKS